MSSISFFHEDSTCRVPDLGQMHLFHLKNRNGKVILQNKSDNGDEPEEKKLILHKN